MSRTTVTTPDRLPGDGPRRRCPACATGWIMTGEPPALSLHGACNRCGHVVAPAPAARALELEADEVARLNAAEAACLGCEQPFRPARPQHVFCDACTAERIRVSTTGRLPWRRCASDACAVVFQPRSKSHRFCVDCAARRRREAWARSKRNAYRPATRPCRTCGTVTGKRYNALRCEVCRAEDNRRRARLRWRQHQLANRVG
jgi:Zn finger protein HypA/HybF involved in hydrogenase expression